MSKAEQFVYDTIRHMGQAVYSRLLMVTLMLETELDRCITSLEVARKIRVARHEPDTQERVFEATPRAW